MSNFLVRHHNSSLFSLKPVDFFQNSSYNDFKKRRGVISMAKKYQDVYCQLKADIYTKYPLGSFLPPELELMQIYNTSRTTIRRAVSILKDEHILDVRQGRGTQVLLENYSYQKDPPFFHNVSSIESNYLIDQKDNHFKVEGCIVDIIPATKDISNHLNIPMGTLVYRLERIQVLNDIPYAFIKNYIRCDLTPGLEQYSGQSDKIGNLYRLMQAKYGVVFATGKENISTQLCSLFDSKILGTKPGMPLLYLQRTAFTTTHEVMEYAERLIRPDILNFEVTMIGAPTIDLPALKLDD